jgi:hypothetical protein
VGDANNQNYTIYDADGNIMQFKTKAECIDGIISLAHGGTGINALQGGKLIASSQDGLSFEELDFDFMLINGLTDNIQKQLDAKSPKDHGRHIPDECTRIRDWDNATTNGWYYSINGVNIPEGTAVGTVLSTGGLIVQKVFILETEHELHRIRDDSGKWTSWVDTSATAVTYEEATEEVSGLMPYTDKRKLNSYTIADGTDISSIFSTTDDEK